MNIVWNIFGWRPCKCANRGTPGKFHSRPTRDGFYYTTTCPICHGAGMRPIKPGKASNTYIC